MDKLLVIANWKSHKNEAESIAFLEEFRVSLDQISQKCEIIILPQYSAVSGVRNYIKDNNLPISIGVQTVSSFEDGAYTGEVSARQASEFAKYTLLNHSERRKYNHETDEDLSLKFEQAKKAGLIPIVCIQDVNSQIPEGAGIVVFEPASAISTFGTGKPETPEEISAVFNELSQKGNFTLLYGGSVTPDDIQSYVAIPSLKGVLVGAASLEPSSFIDLLSKC